ncbi:MAG: flavodoxin family protein [Deltaproteobacteria bacterium]|nr:flavodoxin family protein [Deltaproteobacteria bacterium]
MQRKVKILGICGSPRKGGNTEYALKQALEAAMESGNVETEFLGLAGKNIAPCTGCSVCMIKLDPERFCFGCKEDDLQPVIKKCIEADAIIIGSPVYLWGIPSNLKAFIDRAGLTISANGMLLRNKVGAAIVTAGARNVGTEPTVSAIHSIFLLLDMVPIGIGPERPVNLNAITGGILVEGYPDYKPTDIKEGYVSVAEDKYGLLSVRGVGKRVADLTKVIVNGLAATPEKELNWPPSKVIPPAYSSTETTLNKKE